MVVGDPITMTKRARGLSTPVPVPVKRRIRIWLAKHDKTQTDLAIEIGIRPSHLSSILSGTRAPSLKVAKRLEEITRIRATAFVSTIERARP